MVATPKKKEEYTWKQYFQMFFPKLIVSLIVLWLISFFYHYIPLIPIFGTTYLSLAGKCYGRLGQFHNVYDRLVQILVLLGNPRNNRLKTAQDKPFMYNKKQLQVSNQGEAATVIQAMATDKKLFTFIMDRVNDLAADSEISLQGQFKLNSGIKQVPKRKGTLAKLPLTNALIYLTEFLSVGTYKPAKDGKPASVDFVGKSFPALKTEIVNDPQNKKDNGEKRFVVLSTNKIAYAIEDECTNTKMKWYLKQSGYLLMNGFLSMLIMPFSLIRMFDKSKTEAETKTDKKCPNDNSGSIMRWIWIGLAAFAVLWLTYTRINVIFRPQMENSPYAGADWSKHDWYKTVPILLIAIALTILFGYQLTQDESWYDKVINERTMKHLFEHFGIWKFIVVILIGVVLLGMFWNSIWSISVNAGSSWGSIGVAIAIIGMIMGALLYLANTALESVYPLNYVSSTPVTSTSSLSNISNPNPGIGNSDL